MSENKPAPDPLPETATVNVKLPRWLKQLAATIGEVTGEDIGEVIIRHAGESIKRECHKVATNLVNTLAEGQ